VNRRHPFAVGMGFPRGKHVLHEAPGNRAVLIEENHPWITLACGPANTLIQGFGDAAILAVLDQFVSPVVACHSQRIEFVGTRTVVHDDQFPHLLTDLRYVCQGRGAGMICHYHGTYRFIRHAPAPYASMDHFAFIPIMRLDSR